MDLTFPEYDYDQTPELSIARELQEDGAAASVSPEDLEGARSKQPGTS
ncbi:MAG: hypothetical protein AVDCRST_MAG31-268 [uncultured Sphingomonas sp.]|uniref:Uncharacterized protein n=1 Tax=uncultured Sphingomonas sp. TaxID=158754 RepID=A0A6J4SNM4_9SPHN|nr:hypothetical protein [uncultured Sphingomonas sp.]CAA9499261.1 MAG: hypothetical protein AVDCRST_MAG31-268 [uncultured Sphingomonas sp.]